MLRIWIMLVVAVAFIAPPSPALAQVLDEGAEEDPGFKEQMKQMAKSIAKQTVKRARRSIALGPFISASPTIHFKGEGSVDVQLAAGIGLYKFDIPILPSREVLQEEIVGRFKDELKKLTKEAIKEAILNTGKRPTKEELAERKREFARKLWDDIKKDLLMRMRPKTFEKPSFAVRADVSYSADSEAWDIRVSGAIGIGPVYLVPSANLVITPNVVFFIPAEISLPITLGSGTRTKVIDLFARVDFAAHGRSKNSDRATIGVRFLLDTI